MTTRAKPKPITIAARPCPRGCTTPMHDVSKHRDGARWKCNACGWLESIRDCAGTPDTLFSKLAKRFSFDLDACATRENAKCKLYYSPKEDGLVQSWIGDGWTYCNPPYSNIEPWVNKAIQSARDGASSVLLLPNDTSTAWFRRCYDSASEIWFLIGPRVQFVAPKGLTYSTNTGTNVVVVFREREMGLGLGPAKLTGWEWMRG